MPEKSLLVRLEEMDHCSGQFMLTFDSLQYPVTIKPESNVTLNDWLRHLHPVLAGQQDPAGQLSSQQLLRDVGMWLWHTLFIGNAHSHERDTLARLLRTGHTPLLLALPDMLAGLPWELLYDPQISGERGFLSLRRPLMRLSASAPAVAPIRLPLRVLLLISSPPSLGENSRVDVESEYAAVEQATQKAREEGKLHLLVEDIVTVERVQQALITFQPHIVHYIGHGEYNATIGGLLVWEDAQGNELSISEERLAQIFSPRNLHAVVLHACQTGCRDARMNISGVAGTLVKEGVPVVLAQQANFTYASSQRASKAWYTTLAAQRGFAEALFEVRQALSLTDRPDWAVPVLYGSMASLEPLFANTALPGPPDPLLISTEAATDLPTPAGVFVGRHRELRALRLMLESVPGRGPVMALITGPGGIGKSTLAAQAITRYGRTYKATLTLPCQGYQGVELFLQRMGNFLKRLGAPAFLEQCLPDPELSTETKIEEVIVALNLAGPLLLVIDNLENVQNDDQTISDMALLHLLQKLLTNLRGGRVLIMCRYMVKDLFSQGKFAANLFHLDLDDLSTYETTQLLMRHPALARLGKEVRETLMDEFGGLPYVYDLLSSNAASQSLDLLVHDVRGRIIQTRTQHSAKEWQEVRQQVIEFAALKATVNCLSAASQVLLARLSVLDQSFPLAAIEKGLGATRMEWQPLLDWSLLRFDPHERNYHLHSITRHFAEKQLDEQHRRQAQADLAAWYQRYAQLESYQVTDILEAHHLWRASGNVRQAGDLAMQFAEPLKNGGLHSLLRKLCILTLEDTQEHDEQLATQALFYLGTIDLLQGNYKEAQEFSQRSLEIAKRLGDPDRAANSLHQLGVIAQEQGEYQKSGWLLQQSLSLFVQRNDQSGQARSLHHLGILAHEQGNYLEAQRLLQQSLEIEEQLGNGDGRAHSLHELGILAQERGDYDEAKRRYQQSLAIFEQLHNRHYRATILCALGSISLQQRSYQEALQLTLDSQAIAEQLGDQRGRAGALHQLGDIALDQGSYQEARERYQRSLEIKEWLNDPLGQARTLHALGIVAQKQGNYKGARGFYQQTLEIAERIGDQQGIANALYQLGIIALLQGDDERALSYLRPAYNLFHSLNNAPSREITQRKIAELIVNRICKEVVTALRAENTQLQETLATQLQQMLKEDPALEGVQSLFELLIAWLRGLDTRVLAERLQPAFHQIYMRMVAAVAGVLTVEELPRVVASRILQGTIEERQRLAAELRKNQEALLPQSAPLGRFLGCLAAALDGEMPEVALLDPPFTKLWQTFQDALSASPDASSPQEEENND